jgi:hypothetical protein
MRRLTARSRGVSAIRFVDSCISSAFAEAYRTSGNRHNRMIV